ncbi:glycosyltransferase [bacterium]|nr:glycosyltransferase [bacterium]
MKQVVIRGPLLTASGYGEHARQIYTWATSNSDWQVNAQLTPWGNTTWYINPDLLSGLVGKIMSNSGPLERTGADVSFQIQLPNEWDPMLARFNVGVTAAVETDVCNPEWVHSCNKMDLVIVPTNHTKQTLLNSGNITTEIQVVPEAYFNELVNDEIKELDLGLKTEFNFLMVGTLTGNNPWNDRKNSYCTIKWFCETFKDNPNVGLVIKASSGRATTLDRLITKRALKQLLDEVRPGPYPRVNLLHGLMTGDEMSALYRTESIKGFIGLTRGEGFGLPILEAATAGIPVIATNWSGHLDFMNKGKFLSVNYKLQEIHESRIDNQIFIKGSRWAEPSEDHFKSRLSKFYEKPNAPKEWAESLSKTLKETHSITSIMKCYSAVKEEFIK